MNKKVSLGLVLLLCLITLSACGKENNQLIGTWECDYDGAISTFVFNKNGNGSEKITVEDYTSDRDYTYKTDNNKLLITFNDDKDFEFTYGYRFDKDKLILKDSLDEEFSCIKK